MAAFIYRCPVTGYNVQAFIADDPTKGREDAFQSVTCTVCGRVHQRCLLENLFLRLAFFFHFSCIASKGNFLQLTNDLSGLS